MFGKMVGKSSGVRGLIPKSRGARIAMGAGVGSAVGGGLVLAMNNSRNKNKPYTSPGITGPSLQKHYDWQIAGGASDAQARQFISTIRPGEDLSGIKNDEGLY